MMRILYVGTAEFAINPLEKLAELDDIEVVGIVTQPDRPAGRGRELSVTPIKQLWLDNPELNKIRLFQPEKLWNDSDQILTELNPDLIIVAAYGQMIPDNMLNQPKYGAWNLHGSLLPKLRGAVPVHMAILQGLEETGVTIQQMVKELDAGDILSKKSLLIDPEDTTESLMIKISSLAAEMLPKALEDLERGDLQGVEQHESEATFCYQSDISKSKAEITENTDVEVSERMVRAFYPWPIAWIVLPDSSKYAGKRVQIFASEVVKNLDVETDEFMFVHEKSIYLKLSGGYLKVNSLKLEGKQIHQASDYLYLFD